MIEILRVACFRLTAVLIGVAKLGGRGRWLEDQGT